MSRITEENCTTDWQSAQLKVKFIPTVSCDGLEWTEWGGGGVSYTPCCGPSSTYNPPDRQSLAHSRLEDVWWLEKESLGPVCSVSSIRVRIWPAEYWECQNIICRASCLQHGCYSHVDCRSWNSPVGLLFFCNGLWRSYDCVCFNLLLIC